MAGTDAIQMLVNLSNNLLTSFVHLAFTLGSLFAVTGAFAYLATHASQARKAPGHSESGGKVIAVLLLCGSKPVSKPSSSPKPAMSLSADYHPGYRDEESL
ncbi:hypothetical protein SFA35_26070 (plasmid) [Pseudomonas sp. HR96]|uniref:hypothetical protein n=1 Tax=Pseudomonas sp. HR96 TaxID=1027966 RepID=UPI002A749C53|nr:hypothetical protein [Pseudomonas sp. HR96]WPP02570.1 hypothetical protein SFA35_26070 [Pseudomonas sp. HR96]